MFAFCFRADGDPSPSGDELPSYDLGKHTQLVEISLHTGGYLCLPLSQIIKSVEICFRYSLLVVVLAARIFSFIT